MMTQNNCYRLAVNIYHQNYSFLPVIIIFIFYPLLKRYLILHCTSDSKKIHNAIIDSKLFSICCKCESFKRKFQEVVAKGKSDATSDEDEVTDTLKTVENLV